MINIVKFFGILLLICLGIWLMWYPLGNIHYSDGIRQGKLIKWSHRGFFIKNWCGEIALSGFVTTEEGVSPYIFEFGVDRRKDTTELRQKIAEMIGKNVEVVYEQKAFGGHSLIGCSDYLVKEIREVK